MNISILRRGIAWTLLVLFFLVLSACVTSPPITVTPALEKGPAVILLSGLGGDSGYQSFADAVGKLGYVAFLADINNFIYTKADAGKNLQKLMEAVQQDSRVIPGKVAIIGFSLGGRIALVYGTSHTEKVSAVIAFYPAIIGLENMPQKATRVAVPTLILAGEKDRFFNCCRIKSIREFEVAARKASVPVTLVSYPGAAHGFNLQTYPTQYRAADAEDAWERAKSFLLKHHPLP
jgi:dienelactone hydrolase